MIKCSWIEKQVNMKKYAANYERVCYKIACYKMCATICEGFVLNLLVVAGYID